MCCTKPDAKAKRGYVDALPEPLGNTTVLYMVESEDDPHSNYRQRVTGTVTGANYKTLRNGTFAVFNADVESLLSERDEKGNPRYLDAAGFMEYKNNDYSFTPPQWQETAQTEEAQKETAVESPESVETAVEVQTTAIAVETAVESEETAVDAELEAAQDQILEAELDLMLKAELIAIAGEMGLATSGTKAQLKERILGGK